MPSRQTLSRTPISRAPARHTQAIGGGEGALLAGQPANGCDIFGRGAETLHGNLGAHIVHMRFCWARPRTRMRRPRAVPSPACSIASLRWAASARQRWHWDCRHRQISAGGQVHHGRNQRRSLDLANQTISVRHYPDGFILCLETLFAPAQDRDVKVPAARRRRPVRSVFPT